MGVSRAILPLCSPGGSRGSEVLTLKPKIGEPARGGLRSTTLHPRAENFWEVSRWPPDGAGLSSE